MSILLQADTLSVQENLMKRFQLKKHYPFSNY
jgi:hypothetical protein